jgi:quercetin dioxygenase-like cupin family protein
MCDTISQRLWFGEETTMGDDRPGAVRLLVTGHDRDGRATVAGDGPVEPAVLPSGTTLHRLWGCDEAPTFPDDGRASASESPFPGPGGFRFSVWTVPPAYASAVHATPTVDCGIVLSGGLWLELEDGVERHLRAGDGFVQNGTRHAWRNRGDEPAVVAVFIAGAHHADLPIRA